MKIRIGYDIAFECRQRTSMLLSLRVHPSREKDLERPDIIRSVPAAPLREYRDGFGNICGRTVIEPGVTHFTTDTVINDSGLPDPVVPEAVQHDIPDLPSEVLVFLLGSRYCETDKLSDTAWNLFGTTPPGWARVQAICDYVHEHVQFGYELARPTKSASDVHVERGGVCRDFAHLAVTFCRCMNIPARYVTGYLGDIGVPPDPAPMDFSAWFEAWLGGRWHTFDARHNVPRIGRILIATGRDASDVAISNSFGPTTLAGFQVWTEEVAA
ncbi:MAG TPA: transglutaminase family protein [Bauldia sp.]|nr:transglutaminase family protein [Bauldia sp.]